MLGGNIESASPHGARSVVADADMAVKANLDELFDLPQGFYAVSDCTAGRVSKQEQDNCPFSGCSRYFNAGMLCLNPRHVLKCPAGHDTVLFRENCLHPKHQHS